MLCDGISDDLFSHKSSCVYLSKASTLERKYSQAN